MVDDAEYLYDALSPWITQFVDKDHALEVHRNIARPTLVHKGILESPDCEQVDDLRVERDAIARALTTVKNREAALVRHVSELEARSRCQVNQIIQLQVELENLRSRLTSNAESLDQERVEHDRVKGELTERLVDTEVLIEALRARIDNMKVYSKTQTNSVKVLRERVETLEMSTSFRLGWALTAPGRFAKALFLRG